MTSAFLADLRAAVSVLELLVADRALLAQVPPDDQRRLLQAAGQVYAPDVGSRRQLVRATARRRKAERVEREETARHQTGIRALRRQPVYTSPNVFPPATPEAFAPEDSHDVEAPREPLDPQHCYVCKASFTSLHHFYDQLCPPCAEFNLAKRTELADLGGTVALVTGGRVKIGYQAGLKLLRAGAHLIVTTRFPRDSAA
ncbi:MAG: oxidoreductase, partial [Gemmatimonadales bacterium]